MKCQLCLILGSRISDDFYFFLFICSFKIFYKTIIFYKKKPGYFKNVCHKYRFWSIVIYFFLLLPSPLPFSFSHFVLRKITQPRYFPLCPWLLYGKDLSSHSYLIFFPFPWLWQSISIPHTLQTLTMNTTHPCHLSTHTPKPFWKETGLPYTRQKPGYPGIKDATALLYASNMYPQMNMWAWPGRTPNPSCICSSFWLTTSSTDGFWFTFQPSPCPRRLKRKSLGPFHGRALSGSHYWHRVHH